VAALHAGLTCRVKQSGSLISGEAKRTTTGLLNPLLIHIVMEIEKSDIFFEKNLTFFHATHNLLFSFSFLSCKKMIFLMVERHSLIA
jgi:hypothetical protein